MLRSLGAGDGSGPPGPDCLDEDTLAELVDGALEPPRRADAMRHLAGCARCRGAVASLAEALASPEVAAAAASRPRARRLLRVGIPAAAAAAVLFVAVLGRPAGRSDPPPAHRAPADTSAERPLALSPVGPGVRPESLRWQSVGGADLYRVTLYRADGRVLYARELRDTTTGLPDAIRLAPGGSYLWMVEARTGWNRWSASPLFEFTVRRDGSP
jgi:hypothetical protein